jgi:hypothetical protein
VLLELTVNLERILRELRLMKGQANHRFYASFALVVLFALRHPVTSIAAAALLGWQALK